MSKVSDPLYFVISADLKRLPGIEALPSILRKYTDVQEVGNFEEGFDHTRLLDNFKQESDGSSKAPINIILAAHGVIDPADGIYKISTLGTKIPLDPEAIEKKLQEYEVTMLSLGEESYPLEERNSALAKYRQVLTIQRYELVSVPAEEIISSLVKATNGHALKIFAICCFGANLQKFLGLLPPNSALITLSDSDCPTNAKDLTDTRDGEQMLDTIFANGFCLEKLVELYCLNQRTYQSTPIIGKVDSDGSTHSINLAEYTLKHLKGHNPMPQFFKDFFAKYHIEEAYLRGLVDKVLEAETLDILKVNPNLYRTLAMQEGARFNDIDEGTSAIYSREDVTDEERQNLLEIFRDANNELICEEFHQLMAQFYPLMPREGFKHQTVLGEFSRFIPAYAYYIRALIAKTKDVKSQYFDVDKAIQEMEKVEAAISAEGKYKNMTLAAVLTCIFGNDSYFNPENLPSNFNLMLVLGANLYVDDVS